jgi:hypothetical protein
MNQVDLTTLADSTLQCHVTMHTTKRDEALQSFADADAALAKIDAEFARRDSQRAVGGFTNKFHNAVRYLSNVS